jgi:hypothetical protein
LIGHLQSGIQGEYHHPLGTRTLLKAKAEYRCILHLHGLFHPEKQWEYIKYKILEEDSQPTKK